MWAQMQICQIHSVTFNGFIFLLLLILYHYITIIIYLFIYLFILVHGFFSVIYLLERNTVIQYNA